MPQARHLGNASFPNLTLTSRLSATISVSRDGRSAPSQHSSLSRLVSSRLLLSYPILSYPLISSRLLSTPLLSSPLQLLQRSQPQTLASAGCMMEEVGHGSRFPYHPCRPASQPQPQRISVFASPRFPLSCCKKG